MSEKMSSPGAPRKTLEISPNRFDDVEVMDELTVTPEGGGIVLKKFVVVRKEIKRLRNGTEAKIEVAEKEAYLEEISDE